MTKRDDIWDATILIIESTGAVTIENIIRKIILEKFKENEIEPKKVAEIINKKYPEESIDYEGMPSPVKLYTELIIRRINEEAPDIDKEVFEISKEAVKNLPKYIDELPSTNTVRRTLKEIKRKGWIYNDLHSGVWIVDEKARFFLTVSNEDPHFWS